MNEFDKNQLKIMDNKISNFKSEKLNLHNLIYDLEDLLNILEENDKNWKASFRGYWWELEQVYATMLDQDRQDLDFEDREIINNAISNLEFLIRNKLNN